MVNENAYKEYLERLIENKEAEFRAAMSEDRFDDACIFGKQLADLESTYSYHYIR